MKVLSFPRQLETYTKGESVFRVIENYFKEKGTPLTNIFDCATDGEQSMISRHRRFVNSLNFKKNASSVYGILYNPQATSGRLQEIDYKYH